MKNGQVAAALAAAGAMPAGLHALDMARMELGKPRPGVDITSLVTPVSASMVSMIKDVPERMQKSERCLRGRRKRQASCQFTAMRYPGNAEIATQTAK